MNKKYYWLKLKSTFFNQLEQKKMRRQENGSDMLIIYLKMMLLSIDKDCIIAYQGVENSIEEELAFEFGEDKEIVKQTIDFLVSHKLIEIVEDDTYFLVEAKECIGSETDSAGRMRKYRKNKTSQSDTPVTTSDSLVTTSDTEIEKDIEKDIEIEKEKRNKNNTYIVEILDYLNKKINSSYKSSTNKTKDLIKARIQEGFTVEDFKTVIDKKSNEWIGTEWEKYLRPSTLFGAKFESYLNQVNTTNKNRSTGDELLEMIRNGEFDEYEEVI